jgi:hypothetical protein
MEVRFAGDEADLAALMEEELIREAQLEMLAAFVLNRERERMREIMRLRTDKLIGGSPAQLMEDAWLGWE